jgi:hypothetical protein
MATPLEKARKNPNSVKAKILNTARKQYKRKGGKSAFDP